MTDEQMNMTNQLKMMYEEIKVWETVSHIHICKIFELFDDMDNNKIYLMMELCEWGQIQHDKVVDKKIVLTRDEKIYDIAVPKGKKIWPSKAGNNDVEHAARWIFYDVLLGLSHLHDTMRIVHRDIKH